MTNPASVKEHSSPGDGVLAARNTAVLILLRLVVPMLSLALVFTLSRALGAEGLGRSCRRRVERALRFVAAQPVLVFKRLQGLTALLRTGELLD